MLRFVKQNEKPLFTALFRVLVVLLNASAATTFVFSCFLYVEIYEFYNLPRAYYGYRTLSEVYSSPFEDDDNLGWLFGVIMFALLSVGLLIGIKLLRKKKPFVFTARKRAGKR